MTAIAPESSNGLAQLIDCVEQTSTVSLKFDSLRPHKMGAKKRASVLRVSKGKERKSTPQIWRAVVTLLNAQSIQSNFEREDAGGGYRRKRTFKSLCDDYFVREQKRSGAVVKLNKVHPPIKIIHLAQDARPFAESAAPIVVAHRPL